MAAPRRTGRRVAAGRSTDSIASAWKIMPPDRYRRGGCDSPIAASLEEKWRITNVCFKSKRLPLLV
jgi:hypothetical protein